jgi:hypothetical protein
MEKISLAIPVHQLVYRWNILKRLIDYAEQDERIEEIVLSIEPDSEKLAIIRSKVMTYYNEKQEYVFRNKFKAVAACKNKWVIVFDSDNQIDKRYIDVLYSYYPWKANEIYQPEFLRPKFDLREFSGLIIDRSMLRNLMKKPMCRVMMNAMNYFVNKDTFIAANQESFDSGFDPKCSDSLHVNWNLFRHNNRMRVVPGLQYDHLIHSHSFYKQVSKEFGAMVTEAEQRLINL